MILTKEEVQKALLMNNLEITDEEAEYWIEYYTNKLTSLTGISLTPQTYHYTLEYKQHLRKIVLPLYNIYDVLRIHTDFKILSSKEYFVDTKNGVIFFKKPLTADHIHIEYLTYIDETVLNEIIKPLLLDMIVDGTINGNSENDGFSGGEISSIHEGNTSISFSNSTSLKNTIQSRLDKLANGEIITTPRTRKGAYYL